MIFIMLLSCLSGKLVKIGVIDIIDATAGNCEIQLANEEIIIVDHRLCTDLREGTVILGKTK